jgi:hypothetical protein
VADAAFPKPSSVLDSQREDQAIMELAGKTMHSKHLREPHPEDD